ncbi:MAG: GNAT family N-acetyltransferase [Ginsengibacter sp.]
MKVELEEIMAFRILFLHANGFQFIHNKCHDYGWADTYLFTINGKKAGYGAVWGKSIREARDAIFEFYVIKPLSHFSNFIFQEFYPASGATFIECQSNDPLLSSMLYEYSQNINAEAILFEDNLQTNFDISGVIFTRKPAERSNIDDVGGYVLEQNGEVAATGGFMLNYNKPYADIYYDVKENFRQKGFGSLIIQHLKKEIYLMGRVPAARCNTGNHRSKSNLLKAGFKVCGFILTGDIKTG